MVNSEADISKSSRPAATRVSDPSIFQVASDDSFVGECSAEGANVLQVIGGPPETPMYHK